MVLTRAQSLRAIGSIAAATAFPRIVVAQVAPTIAVGVAALEAQSQVMYAQDLGLFKKAGLNVDLQILRGGSAIAAAVSGGSLQIGASNTLSLAYALNRGIPFVMIAGGALYDIRNPSAGITVLKDATIQSGRELNGKLVGGISLSGQDQLALWSYIDKVGGDVSTVKFLEIPGSELSVALAQGRISAASMNNPDWAIAVTDGKVRTIGGLESIAKVFLQSAYFCTRDWLANNQDAARRFGHATIEAGLWAKRNPERAAVILGKYTSTKANPVHIPFADTTNMAGFIQPVYDRAAKFNFLPHISATDYIWTGTGA
jgi:NitT/TauT family transport system substrate-binding protein